MRPRLRPAGLRPARLAAPLAATLAAGLVLTACGTPAPDGAVTLVDVEEAAALAVDDDVTVLDVRTPAEFGEGHLAGAVNVDATGDFATAIADLDPEETYLVYCRSGSRSATATAAMAEAGFTDVHELRGGVLAWQAAGGPLTAP
ncbi:rhodanese-like domain-containing protein [Actinotalea sp. AC32]|nr:rhodanese-like domain-containing protein [Actinotalea sp. AC32]